MLAAEWAHLKIFTSPFLLLLFSLIYYFQNHFTQEMGWSPHQNTR